MNKCSDIDYGAEDKTTYVDLENDNESPYVELNCGFGEFVNLDVDLKSPEMDTE